MLQFEGKRIYRRAIHSQFENERATGTELFTDNHDCKAESLGNGLIL